MFAKVFGQIFDSSIAEDYNCRRMFMDLLVLADSDGVVDMTPEAISRRSNVPIDQVNKYIHELQQPDPLSRSKMEEGKRIVSIDPQRGWGWKIVNYHHYRKIRDEEARRSYFRDAKRKQRKKSEVKDKKVDSGGRCQTVTSASSCNGTEEWLVDLSTDIAYKGIDVRREYAKALRWSKENKVSMSRRRFVNWLNRADRKLDIPADKIPHLDKSKIDVPERFKAWAAERYPGQREIVMKWRVWSDVPKNGIREEWWREEKKKLPVGDLI